MPLCTAMSATMHARRLLSPVSLPARMGLMCRAQSAVQCAICTAVCDPRRSAICSV